MCRDVECELTVCVVDPRTNSMSRLRHPDLDYDTQI